MSLTPRQERFIQEYLVDLNGKQAAIRAGYTVRRAEVTASELLANRKVSEEIAKAQAKRAERVELSQDAVVKQLWGVATANANELVEFRRCCCRYCWGEGNRYQRTRGEFERDEEQLAALNEQAVQDGKPVKAFDPKGGHGYDRRKAPNPECPECFGDGIGYTHVHDTRNVSPEAMLLYAGVKETKEGFEVKMHSPEAARQMLGRHLGMFKDRLEIDANVRGSVSYKANIPARGNGGD